MIIAKAEKEDGRVLLFLGLSSENVDRLVKGQPIFKDLSAIHPDMPNIDVLIVHGEDEADLGEQLHIISRGQVPR